MKPETDDFVLDTDVEIPPPTIGHRDSKYKWHQYKAGNSHFYPGVTMLKLWSSLGHHRKQNGGKWVLRTVTENGVLGTRVWRTA